ncbi:putative uncharacterized protein [Roseburia sp. CAG:182]|nr:putative uncharacterized protein [Roseburia sp. CAG:182]
MAKKIGIDVDLRDEKAKKKLKELQNGKYKVDLDVDVNDAKQATQSMNQLSSATKSTSNAFDKLRNAAKDMFSTERISLTAYVAIMREIDKAAENMVKSVKDIDKAITDLSIATNMSRKETAELVNEYNAYAKQLASTTTQVTSAGDDYLRAGKTMSEANALIKDSIMLSKLGQIDSGEATEDLLATMNGFDMSVKEINKALDSMVAIDMAAATSSGDIATALKYCASSADVAGVSFDKLAAMIGTVQDKTQQSAETVGTFMNTLLSRYRNVKIAQFVDDDGEDLSDVETILGSVGIKLRETNQEFRDFEDVIDDVAKSWNTYSGVQQAAIAKAFGGTRQQNRFIALMEGYNKTLELTQVAAESAGTAVDKFNNSYMNSLEAKENTLQASFESLVTDSDFDKVYVGILDATTALFDFVKEVNGVKSALGGLAVGGGIKAFLAIKTGVNEAYITLNKFKNALDLVKKTKISTAEFDRLLLLSDGLSKSQMKLILSTNTLTVAQKKQLLMASGLSEEEATLQLQTWKMTAANDGLTASTTSAGNAFRGLWATLKANPLMLIVSAVTIGISIWQKYKQSMEEAVSAASDAANAYKEQTNSLDDQITKYQELRQQLITAKGNEEETQAVKEQLLALQQELNEQFGEEYGKLNLVTDAYKDQTEAIKAYNKEAANVFLNKNRKGIEVATDKMESDNTYSLGSMNGLVSTDELEILEKIKGLASENGIDFTDSGFEFVGNAEEADKAINAFMNSLKELREQTGETSNTVSSIFDGLLDNSGEALAKADDIISEYKDIYEQAQLAEIASSDKLSVKYNEMMDAVQAYNDAVSNSENPYGDSDVQSAYDNLQKIKNEIADSSDWNNYRNIVDETFSEADDATYTFYEDLQKNKDGIKDLTDSLQGLSATDLQAMFDDGESGDSFDKLSQKADKYGVNVQNLIDLLEKLGIVQGENEKLEDVETPTISFSDTMTQLDDMKSKLSAVDQVYAKLFDEDASIGFDDYSSLYDTFKDIEGLDIGSYIEQLQEAGQDQEKVQSTIDSMMGKYLQLSGVLDIVNDSNKDFIVSMLQEQGIANADAIITETLAAKKAYAAITSKDLADATAEDIVQMLRENVVTEETKNQIIAYYLEKEYASGVTLDTSNDVEQLMTFISALGGATSALSIYYHMLNGGLNVSEFGGNGGMSGKDGQYAKQMAQVQAEKEIEKIKQDTLSSINSSTPKFTGGSSTKATKDKAAKDASKGAKDAEDAAKKAAEEAEKALTDALSRIKNAIDELDKEASDKFSNWSSRNQALADEMGMIPQEIAKQQELYDFYMSQGDTTKAEEAANAIKDLQRNLKELANQKLENIKQFYSDIIDLIDSLKELKNAYIDLKEAKGLVANEVDYRELIAQSENERQNYEKELSELQNQLQDNINNGYIEEGSEAWIEWQKELNGIKKSIIECQKEQVEWINAIKRLPFDALEKYTMLINKATERIQNANDIMEAKGLSQSIANVNEQLMALNETMSVTVHERKLVFDALRDGLSDSVNGWASLTEEQINKVFDYINTDDPLGLHDYLTSLGVDMYQFAADGESSVWGYVQQLSTLNSKIQETEKSQIELNKSIRDMGVKSAEAYGKLIDKANADIDNQSTLWEARGMDKTLAHYQQALQGLDMSIGSASNKRYQDVAKIYANFADGVNGWSQLDTSQIDKVMEFVNSNDSQGLFTYLGSLGIDASQLDEFWELVEDIQSIDSDITSTKQKQIEFNKALQQMDISTYEKLNELVSKAKTELEGLKNLIESHGKNASDNLLSKQIENSMKSVDLSKSMIGTYRDYISSQLSDNVSGWAKLTQEQINKVFSYLDANDTDGLNKYFNSLGMSAGTLTEFWEVVNKISSEESNIFSEMTNQEKYFDEMLENRISQLDDIKEKLNKINDAKNKALELEKARFALIQAMNNRNVMTWDGNQMVWTQDSSAVSSATENLNNLEFQALIDSIEDATDSINELIKNMNLYDDNGNLLSNWKEILASAGTSVDDIVSNIIKTLSARGYNFTDPKFNSGNSVIDSKYKDLISTEDVVDMDLLNSLKSAQQQKTIDLKTYIPDYASIFAKAIQNMPTNNTTTQTTSITYQLNGDFIMPNIHDDAKLDDFIKDLNSLSSKAEQRINRI